MPTVKYKPFQRFGRVPINFIITHQPGQISPLIYYEQIYTQLGMKERNKSFGKNPSRGYTVLPDSVNLGTLVALPLAVGSQVL